MQKVITRAPQDIYGDGSWFLIFLNDEEELTARRVIQPFYNFPSACYVPWSLLTDKERESVWNEYGEECYDGYRKIKEVW